MERKTEYLEKVDLSEESLSEMKLTKVQRTMSATHILIALSLALGILALHFIVRPMTIIGISENVNLATIIGIVASCYYDNI